jgi:hypothetical protein
MKDKSLWFFKNVHLLISLSIVVPTAIIYGSPSILPQHLDIQVATNDLANMLKAIMFLYLGVSIVWVLGIWKHKYWKSATQLNMLFMLTLASGRLLSMLVDGMPTGGYIFGILAEFIIGFYAVVQLKKYGKTVG